MTGSTNLSVIRTRPSGAGDLPVIVAVSAG